MKKFILIIFLLITSLSAFSIGGKSTATIDTLFESVENVYESKEITFTVEKHTIFTRNQILVHYKGKVVATYAPEGILKRSEENINELILELNNKFYSNDYLLLITKENSKLSTLPILVKIYGFN